MDCQEAELRTGEWEHIDPVEFVLDIAGTPGIGAVVESLRGGEHRLQFPQRRCKILR
jgi:hypothetical protein